MYACYAKKILDLKQTRVCFAIFPQLIYKHQLLSNDLQFIWHNITQQTGYSKQAKGGYNS
jgi:hypothetical protein